MVPIPYYLYKKAQVKMPIDPFRDKNGTHFTSYQLPIRLYEDLKTCAGVMGISLAQATRFAVEDWIVNQNKSPEFLAKKSRYSRDLRAELDANREALRAARLGEK